MLVLFLFVVVCVLERIGVWLILVDVFFMNMMSVERDLIEQTCSP